MQETKVINTLTDKRVEARSAEQGGGQAGAVQVLEERVRHHGLGADAVGGVVDEHPLQRAAADEKVGESTPDAPAAGPGRTRRCSSPPAPACSPSTSGTTACSRACATRPSTSPPSACPGF